MNSNSNDAQSAEEIEGMERMVMAFRMQELKSLLTFASQPSHGRKSDMIARALQLVRTTKNQLIKFKVRQLYWQIYDKDRSLLESNYANPSGMSSGMGNNSSPYGIYATATPVTIPPNVNAPVSRNVPPLIAQTATRQNIELNPKVTLTHLPFYDVIKEVLKPTALVPMTSGKFQDNHVTFSLTREQLNMINSNEKAAIPRVELQLRFCLSDQKSDQKDDFPSQCVLRVNDKVVLLPNVIPTNKVGVEPKRPSRPVDISSHLIRHGNGDQRIHVSWQHDGVRVWTVSVFIVRHLTAAVLLNRVKSKGHRPNEESIKMIKEKLGDNDLDLAATSLRVSLLCPLGKVRMRLPCRLGSCKHLQCFDLELFLQMNEKRPTWNCPVCDAPTVPFSDLQVDGYFLHLIAQTTTENEVELYEGGGFAPIADGDSTNVGNDKSASDKDHTACTASVSSAPSTSSATQPKPKQPKQSASPKSDDDCEVIDLISDDEDAIAPKSICSVTTVSSGYSAGVMGNLRSPSSSPSLIILDTPSPPGKSTPEDPRMSEELSTRPTVKRSLMPESSDAGQSFPKRFRIRETGTANATVANVGNFTVAPPDMGGFPDVLRQFMAEISVPPAPYPESYSPVPLPTRVMGETVYGWTPPTPATSSLSSATSAGSANGHSSTSALWANSPHLQQEFETFLKSCLPPSSQ